MEIDWAIRTDTGRVRTQNEDAAHSEPATGLVVLCDGMGGHRAGEIASRLAVDTFLQIADSDSPVQPCPDAPHASPETVRLIQATRAANTAVFSKAECEEECKGMGCTLVALRLANDSATFTTVGDSRLYLLRDGTLHMVSQDHTRLRMLEQMGINLDPTEAKQIQGMLVRALGTQPEVEVDFGQGTAYTGDVWLLCSDGLTDEVDDSGIQTILQQAPDAAKAAENCIQAALDSGGKDNVTVVVARVVSGREREGEERPPRPETCSPHPDPVSDPGEPKGLLSRISRRLRGGSDSGNQESSS